MESRGTETGAFTPARRRPMITDDVLLMGILGSHAYGLARSCSDINRQGVFLTPSRELLGAIQPVADSRESHEPNARELDLGKFMRIALDGRPSALEMLYLEDHVRITETGRQLVGLREHFLSAPAVASGYLTNTEREVKKIVKRHHVADSGFDIRNPKSARHVLRLLQSGLSLYTDGHLPLRVRNRGEIFDFGHSVGILGDMDLLQDTLHSYEDRFAATRSPLPEEPDTAKLSDWLRNVRLDELAHAR